MLMNSLSFSSLIGTAAVKSRLRRFCLAATCFFLPVAAFAQSGSINGRVTAEGTNFFLEGASVIVVNTDFRTSTDRSGRFSINNVPYGDYNLAISYVGYQVERLAVSVGPDSAPLSINLALEDIPVFELEEFAVSSQISGTERALSRQNAANNNVDIIASDNFGLLPDNTVADSLRRLPGINVEKDSQGRAGRYVTIRGMNSDFNAVQVDGQKVMVSNFDGASRSVPLDVVPAKNAESIEVTKSALPSDDADAIGGTINIRSASAFDQIGMAADLEASVGMLSLADDYSGDYPSDELPYEFSASWSSVLNDAETLGLAIAINHANRPFLFRSIENGPWELDGDAYFPSYGRIEEAFDNVETTGLTGRLDFRPSSTFELDVSFNYSLRETNQGSQRFDLAYDPGFLVGPDPVIEGDTAVAFISDDRAYREVRDYYEEQENTSLTVNASHTFGDWNLDYGLGYNLGDFAGDPNKDTRAFFRTGFRDNAYSLQNGDAFNPLFGDDPSAIPADDFEVDEIRRGTRIIEDQSATAYADIQRDFILGNSPAFIKAGVKANMNERDFDDIRRRYSTADTLWTLDSVVINGDETIFGSVLADSGIDRAINGQPFPAMIDPVKIRAAEEALRQAGIRDRDDPNWYLNQNIERDARADQVFSYDLEEDIYATYVEGQIQFGEITLIGGLRLEATEVTVDTFAGDFFVSDLGRYNCFH